MGYFVLLPSFTAFGWLLANLFFRACGRQMNVRAMGANLVEIYGFSCDASILIILKSLQLLLLLTPINEFFTDKEKQDAQSYFSTYK